MQKISRKKVIKWIEENVKQLPPMFYQAFHREFELFSDKKKVKNVKINPDYHYINHNRRCRRMYDRYGVEGIKYYFGLYGYTVRGNIV